MLIPLLLITALGVGGWYVETARARSRSLLSGFFESRPIQIASRIGGRVTQIRVQEGDAVRAGQVLVEFEADTTQAEREAKRALAEQAREQWREVQRGPRVEEIRRQEAVVAEMRATLARLEHGPLPEEIAAARARLREAQARYAETLAGPRPQEVARARAAERTARARLAAARRGPTEEEKEQARERLDAAVAQETLTRADLERMENLLAQGAISKQQRDQAQAAADSAVARRKELAAALQRAEEGTPREELEQAREEHAQAQAALDLVLAGSRREEKDAARAQVAVALQNLRLLQRGTRSEDLQAARAKLAQAKASLDALRAGSRKEQIRQARAAAEAAAASARGAADTLRERVLRAPRDGVVERLLVAVGDLVSPQTPVVRMADPADVWIRVYVPEAHLAKLAVGADATIRVDGIATSVPARIESIATRGEFTPANLQTPEERGKQVFAVRLRLQPPDPRVKAGMYATVTRIGDWP